jgi:hypothetical protein
MQKKESKESNNESDDMSIDIEINNKEIVSISLKLKD